MRTTNQKKYTVIILCVALAFILLLPLTLLAGRTAMNPEGTVGNTAGNLNNAGLFCEYNDTVYFANSFDNGSLYSMSADEQNLKKLNSVDVRNLLAGGKYLYYYSTGSGSAKDGGLENFRVSAAMNRCKLDGKQVTGLTRDTVISGQLVDNYLYLLTTDKGNTSFYKLKIDKSEQIQLADYEINPACAVNGTIYYNGTGADHYLHGLNTATDTDTEIWQGNLWDPIVQGEYVYYLDVAANYRLCRYSMTRDVIEVLTEDRVDCYNIGSGYIYYQKNGSGPELKCMRTDGTEVQTVAEGNYTNINLTSRYAYFMEFGNDATLYHSPLGSGYCETFEAARAAALQ